MVPTVVEPPVVPLTDQVTDLFDVPETMAVKAKESPARIFAVDGETTTVVEGGGGGGFLTRVVAEQPAAKSAARIPPNWTNLRISEDTHQEPLNPESSVVDESARRYWTKGQSWADVRVTSWDFPVRFSLRERQAARKGS
jgi:hypothetical protein